MLSPLLAIALSGAVMWFLAALGSLVLLRDPFAAGGQAVIAGIFAFLVLFMLATGLGG